MPRQIYRIGGDIYNAANDQPIGSIEWDSSWSGQSDVEDLGQRTPQSYNANDPVTPPVPSTPAEPRTPRFP